MYPCSECSNSLNDHPKCKAECDKLLAMKDSSYAKLKLEYQQISRKLKQVEQENRSLHAELKQTKQLVCTLQCDVQTLLESCSADLAKTYPYMETSTKPYISQSLQPRNNETMLAELLRMEKATCARYKAKADTVDALQRELLKAKSAVPKRHDMVFNFNLKGRKVFPSDPLSTEEIDAQGRTPCTASGSQRNADATSEDETL